MPMAGGGDATPPKRSAGRSMGVAGMLGLLLMRTAWMPKARHRRIPWSCGNWLRRRPVRCDQFSQDPTRRGGQARVTAVGGPRRVMKAMTTLRDKTLFINRASRGNGKALALRAARDGARVVVAA